MLDLLTVIPTKLYSANVPASHIQILVYFWMLFANLYMLRILNRHRKQHTFLPRFLFQVLILALVYNIGTIVLIVLFSKDFYIPTAFQTILITLIFGTMLKMIFVFPDEDAAIRQARQWQGINLTIWGTAILAFIHFIIRLTANIEPGFIYNLYDFIPVIFVLWSIVILKSRLQDSDLEDAAGKTSKVYRALRYLMLFSLIGVCLTTIIAINSLFGPPNSFTLFLRSNSLMIVLPIYYFTLTQGDYFEGLLIQRLSLFFGLIFFSCIGIIVFVTTVLLPLSAISLITFLSVLLTEIGLSLFFIFVVPFLLKKIFPGLDSTVQPPPEILITPRQKEVLALIGEGFTNRQIAEALFITEATAKFHVSNLLVEFNCETRYELAKYAPDYT
jgi:DNA-binding CsgD family transcriptional regulator